jgi:repressor LexA
MYVYGDFMTNLTSNQKKVLDFIQDYQQQHGAAPTYRTIAKHFRFKAISSVQQYIQALSEKGYLTKEKYRSQSLSIHKQENLIPLLGKVAAGVPIDSKKHNEKVEVPQVMMKSAGSYFALEVSGDSMIDEGILDGDLVIIREQPTANNGDIIVAEIEDEATIKRFFKKKNVIELVSANPKYKPIIVDETKRLKISGIFCGLLRY